LVTEQELARQSFHRIYKLYFSPIFHADARNLWFDRSVLQGNNNMKETEILFNVRMQKKKNPIIYLALVNY